jgi:hypothetical protein
LFSYISQTAILRKSTLNASTCEGKQPNAIKRV